MKTNELRTGNLLVGFSPTKHAEVVYISDLMVGLIIDGEIGTQTLSQLSPIPLTEEWLKKFGFEHVGEDEHWDNWENRFMEICHNADGWHLSINGFEYTEGKPFLFVHQLQNLYFALTGEELIN